MMKHIQTINEFNRTIGFKYSKPNIKYKAVLFCVGQLDGESLKELLDYIELTHEDIKIYNEETTINIEDTEIQTNLIVEFDFFVYSESEIEKIIEEIRIGLNREFNVQTFDFLIKQSPLLKK